MEKNVCVKVKKQKGKERKKERNATKSGGAHMLKYLFDLIRVHSPQCAGEAMVCGAGAHPTFQ